MKTFKGFNKDMTCTPNPDIKFQYEEGKEYETDLSNCCNYGFHGCEYPLDCFGYYSPERSVYHEVEQYGDISRDSYDTKIASTKIKIGAEINIDGLVKAAIEYTVKRVKPEAKSDNHHEASSATGNYGASTATGYQGASTATGYQGASSATGVYGTSSATGDKGASSATGVCGASSATGVCGASSATGNYGTSSVNGVCGASSVTGYKGASSADHPEAIAVAWGYKSKAKGVVGAYLVLADWDIDEEKYYCTDAWSLKEAKMVRVDGEIIKADTYYTMIGGEVVETK